MIKVNLYKYLNEDGSITVTPVQHEVSDLVYKMRLIADKGKILTDGVDETPCSDCALDEIDRWYEIDDPGYLIIEEEVNSNE